MLNNSVNQPSPLSDYVKEGLSKSLSELQSLSNSTKLSREELAIALKGLSPSTSDEVKKLLELTIGAWGVPSFVLGRTETFHTNLDAFAEKNNPTNLHISMSIGPSGAADFSVGTINDGLFSTSDPEIFVNRVCSKVGVDNGIRFIKETIEDGLIKQAEKLRHFFLGMQRTPGEEPAPKDSAHFL